MQNVSIASRYARALLEASLSSSDEVALQLKQLVQFLLSPTHAELNAALCNPVLPKAKRQALTEGFIASCEGLAPPLANVLRLLTDRARFSLVPTVCSCFESMSDAHQGRVRGTVTSARPLSTAQATAVQTALEALTKKKVALEQKVDAAVLGGVVAQVGSTVYDGSLRNELSRLTARLS